MLVPAGFLLCRNTSYTRMAWALAWSMIPDFYTAATAAGAAVAWWNQDEIIKWLNKQKRAVAAAFIGISVALFLLVLASDVPAFNKVAYMTAAGVFVACSALVMNLFVPFLRMTAREFVFGDAGYEDKADFAGKVEALRSATDTMLEDINLMDTSVKQRRALRDIRTHLPRAYTWTGLILTGSDTPQWTLLPEYKRYDDATGEGKLKKSEELYNAFRQHTWVAPLQDAFVYEHMKFTGQRALKHGSSDSESDESGYVTGSASETSESDDYESPVNDEGDA